MQAAPGARAPAASAASTASAVASAAGTAARMAAGRGGLRFTAQPARRREVRRLARGRGNRFEEPLKEFLDYNA